MKKLLGLLPILVFFAAQAEVIEVNNQSELQAQVYMSQLPVVVDFYMTHCGPCKFMRPIFQSLSMQYAGRVKFVKINSDTGLNHQFGVRKFPTFIFFNRSQNGAQATQAFTLTGSKGEAGLRQLLDQLVANNH